MVITEPCLLQDLPLQRHGRSNDFVAAERVGREWLINERIVVDIWGRRRWVFAFSDFLMLSWQLQRRKDREEAWPHGSVGVSVDGADSASTRNKDSSA